MSTFDVTKIFGKKVATLPEAAVFVSSGFIAPWEAGAVWEFGYCGDIDEASEMVLEETGITVARPGQNGQVLTRVTGDWIWFTTRTQEDAISVINALGITDNNGRSQRPQGMWRFEAPLSKVINLTDEGRQGFVERGKDPLVYVVKHTGVIGHRKGTPYKYQHEFHFIALPAAVAAVANVLGYENPGYDLSELLSTDYAPTDENQAKYIGAEGHDYHDSVLWQRRKALWAALGEDNPEVYNSIPTIDGVDRLDLVGTPGYKKCTSSEKLSKCLNVYESEWEGPVWGRLQLVTDPRVDASYTRSNGEPGHETVPALVELFENEAEAREATNNDGVEQTSQVQDSGNGPVVPELYADYVEDFKDVIREAMKAPVPVRVKLLDEAGVSQADYDAWASLV